MPHPWWEAKENNGHRVLYFHMLIFIYMNTIVITYVIIYQLHIHNYICPNIYIYLSTGVITNVNIYVIIIFSHMKLRRR